MKTTIFALCVVVLAAAGFIGFQKITSQTENETNIEIDFSSEDMYLYEWETYVNPELGFQIRYPDDWEVEDARMPIVLMPPYKMDVNDDGGVYIFTADATLSELKATDTIDRKFIREFEVNGVQAIELEIKLGLWDASYPYPDTRELVPQYVFDVGAHRIVFNVPLADKYRISTLQQIVRTFELVN